MPETPIPAEMGGSQTAFTGIVDLRQAGGDLRGFEHTNEVNFMLYDLPPNNMNAILKGHAALTGYVCSTAAQGRSVSLNTGDVVTFVYQENLTPQRGDVMLIYNHTIGIYGYHKHGFYPEAKKMLGLSNMKWWQIALGAVLVIGCNFLAVIPLLIWLSSMNSKIKEAKDQRSDQLAGWIYQNCSPKLSVAQGTDTVYDNRLRSI